MDYRRISASAAGFDNYWSTVVAPAIRERDGWLCQQCLREGGLAQATAEVLSRRLNKDGSVRQPPVDHIKPAHCCTETEFYSPDNLQVLCVKHNQLKAIADAAKYGHARR